jgi:hypothetical protein
LSFNILPRAFFSEFSGRGRGIRIAIGILVVFIASQWILNLHLIQQQTILELEISNLRARLATDNSLPPDYILLKEQLNAAKDRLTVKHDGTAVKSHRLALFISQVEPMQNGPNAFLSPRN